MRIFAAILREPTAVPRSYQLNGLGKARVDLEAIEKYVAEAWQRITAMREAHPVVGWQAVFLAPEYYFSNQRNLNDRFYSHDVKRFILQGLASLAKKYPKLLIVPGTVLWTKDAADTQIDGKKKPNVKRIENAIKRSELANKRFKTTILTQGWSYTGNMLSPDVKIAQNIAYVCLGSQMIKYQKVGNYKEVENEKGDIYFAPGSIAGRFSVGGIKYGLEICMDHALGALQTTVPSQGQVHVQLIVSSFVSFKQRNTAPVTFHSSTHSSDLVAVTDTGEYGKPGEVKGTVTNIINPGTKQVRFMPGGGGRVAAGFKQNPFKSGPLTVWAVDLDDNKLGISDHGSYKLKDTALPAVKGV